MMSKEVLKNKKSALELMLSENNDLCTDYKAQISKIDQELKDLGKLELTSVQFDDIYEAIEKSVGEFDWNDTDNFEIEYGISYDGKIECESHEFRNSDNLVQMIMDKVSNLFKEADCPEDTPEKVKQQKPKILSKTTKYCGEESKYRESRNNSR